MGYSGPGKISGHSGTEHKHRKAFEKIKSYNSSTSSKSGDFILPIVSSVPTDYQRAYHQDRKIRLYFKLPVFIITVTLVLFFVIKSFKEYGSAFNALNQQQLMDFKTFQNDGKLKDYIFFVKSGNYHLRRNELERAQWEFTRALSIDEYGKGARIGLTKTMIARCQQSNEACEAIQINLNFLSGMKYLSQDNINYLEKQTSLVYTKKTITQSPSSPTPTKSFYHLLE